MSKYRKKPIVIEAIQYVKYGGLVKGMCNSISCYTSGNSEPHVHTIHNNQVVLLEVGDWIIPEPDGEHYYPCKPDIFEATYEKIEEKKTSGWYMTNDGQYDYPITKPAICFSYHPEMGSIRATLLKFGEAVRVKAYFEKTHKIYMESGLEDEANELIYMDFETLLMSMS